jgi:hypothetical protein
MIHLTLDDRIFLRPGLLPQRWQRERQCRSRRSLETISKSVVAPEGLFDHTGVTQRF